MSYDPGEHIKEVFAYYGRAIYAASCVETGLVHALLYLDYLSSVKTEYIRTKGKGFDRKKYEESFDTFMDHHFAQTLGNLIKKLANTAILDDKLKVRIASAKKRRDFLVHNYWREKAYDFASPDGRVKMINELNVDAETFEALDSDINFAIKPAREAVGIKDETLKAYSDELIRRAEAGKEPK